MDTRIEPCEIDLSIVTASFNSGAKLRTTYASIASQNVDFEYLIMDGGSSDGSRQLGEELARSDRRVRIFSEPDKGIYDALNKSLGKTRGKYVYFIGAGDLLLPDSLSQVLRYLPQHISCLVYGDVLKDGARYCGPVRKVDLVGQNICQQAIFYGREVFDICGNFSTRYPSEADWEFNMRCFGNRRIATLYIPVVVAEFEAGGVSARVDTAFRAEKNRLARCYLGLYTHLYVTVRPFYHRLLSRIRRKRSVQH